MPIRVRLIVIALRLCPSSASRRCSPAADDPEPHGPAEQAAGGRRADTQRPPGQTSEGIKGEMVAPMPDGRALTRPGLERSVSWQVAPGMRYKPWDQTDRRGRIRAHLLIDQLAAGPGVASTTRRGRHVPDPSPLEPLLARDNAVAGVNGGFFDIHDTGAPLGVGCRPAARLPARARLHLEQRVLHHPRAASRGSASSS